MVSWEELRQMRAKSRTTLVTRLNELRDVAGADLPSPIRTWLENAGVQGEIEERHLEGLIAGMPLEQLRGDCNESPPLPDAVEGALFDSMVVANGLGAHGASRVGLSIRHRRIETSEGITPKDLLDLCYLARFVDVDARLAEHEFVEQVAQAKLKLDLAFGDPLLEAQLDIAKKTDDPGKMVELLSAAVETLSTCAGMVAEDGDFDFKVPTWSHVSETQGRLAEELFALLLQRAEVMKDVPMAEDTYWRMAVQTAVASAASKPSLLGALDVVPLHPKIQGILYLGELAATVAKASAGDRGDIDVEMRFDSAIQQMAQLWDAVDGPTHVDFRAQEFVDRIRERCRADDAYPGFYVGTAESSVAEALEGLVRLGVKQNGELLSDGYDALAESVAYLPGAQELSSRIMNTYVGIGDRKGATSFARLLVEGGIVQNEPANLDSTSAKAFVHLMDSSGSSREDLRDAALLLAGYASVRDIGESPPVYVCDSETTARALTAYLGKCMDVGDLEGCDLVTRIALCSTQPDNEQIKAVGTLSAIVEEKGTVARVLAYSPGVGEAIRQNVGSKLPHLIMEMDPALHRDLVRARVTASDPWLQACTTFTTSGEVVSYSELALRAAQDELSQRAPELPAGDLRELTTDPLIHARFFAADEDLSRIERAARLLNGGSGEYVPTGDAKQRVVRELGGMLANASSTVLYALSTMPDEDLEPIVNAVREHVGVAQLMERRLDLMDLTHRRESGTTTRPDGKKSYLYAPVDEPGADNLPADSEELRVAQSPVLTALVTEGAVRWSASLDDARDAPDLFYASDGIGSLDEDDVSLSEAEKRQWRILSGELGGNHAASTSQQSEARQILDEAADSPVDELALRPPPDADGPIADGLEPM